MSPPPSRMAAPAAALQLIFLHAGLGARDHRLHGALAQHAGLAHAVEFFRAVDDEEVVQEAFGEHQLGVRQAGAQRVVLVDRHVIFMTRVDLHQPDAAAFELQFLEALDHHFGIAAVAAMAHVLDRDFDIAAHRFRMGAAHRVDHGRLAIERDQHVAAERMPFPVAGQPQHAGAEAPVAGTAGRDHAVELVLLHLGAQRGVAARIFLGGELLVDRVAVIGRAPHIGEGQGLVELVADDLPRLRADRRAGRLHVHGNLGTGRKMRRRGFGRAVRLGDYSMHLPILIGPPSDFTASLAIASLKTCSTVGFWSALM